MLQLTIPVYHVNLKPSELLNSAREIVPFYGRDDDLDDLYRWCRQKGDDPIDVRLYTGEGGVGKTRLMRQLCRQMLRDDNGWRVGFLQIDPDEKQDFAALCEPERPTLVVIDDATLYADKLHEFINEIDRYINQRSSTRKRTAPFRVVLLARTAGDWWDKVKTQASSANQSSVEPRVVTPLGAESRTETFEQAVTAFAKARNYDAVPEHQTLSATLDREPFGRILLIHMLALLTVERSPDQTNASETRILDDILTLEERHWAPLHTKERILSDRLFRRDDARQMVRHLLCLATLGYRIEDEDHLIELCDNLQQLGLNRLRKAERKRLATTLGDLYRNNSTDSNEDRTDLLLPPLKPDLLGEHLIETTLFDAKEEEITDEGEEIFAH
ncbi:MAG: hypothetical protein U5L04_08705 [Trueperaceae bacterium]|nr:hypothetical protein [Trueperaceae bacterium]